MGFDPLRSSREDTVYRHCLKAIDLVLDSRMGAHGLPLIGTGDWNDGLDEIGSQGKGESVWLGFFLVYILQRMTGIVGSTGRPRPAGLLPRAAARRSRRPWNGPGAATATSAPSTTTAPRSASRGAASGRSTP